MGTVEIVKAGSLEVVDRAAIARGSGGGAAVRGAVESGHADECSNVAKSQQLNVSRPVGDGLVVGGRGATCTDF